MNVEEGVITLIEPGNSDQATLVRAQASSVDSPPLRITDLLVEWMVAHRKPFLSNSPRSDKLFTGFELEGRIRHLLCVPLEVHNNLIGILTLFNARSTSGFSQPDQRFLSIVASQSAPLLSAARLASEKNRILSIFGPHIPHSVANLLLERGGDIQSERREVCTMFLDLRGYTAFAESREPEEVVHYLNHLFSFMLEIVAGHGGIVHQLLGDGFMAVFGAPIGGWSDSQNALDSALAISGRVQEEIQAGSVPATRISIGLHTGEVLAGIVGSENRKEYKVTGDAVNVAARVEQANRRFGTEILLTESVRKRVDTSQIKLDSVGTVQVKGRKEPLALYSAKRRPRV
jgi:class 3 adenylate cyclase